MATSLALWQVDPFFNAAEEVQSSADRMESAYRSWKHMKTLVGSSPCDPLAKNTINARRRELVTALETVKWQLEEFERAVEVAMLTEQVYLGESAPSRHWQFVRAIRSQVLSVNNELGDTFGNQVSQSPSKNAAEGVNDLAEFLLGNRIGKGALENDTHVTPVISQQPSQNDQFSEKNWVQCWGDNGNGSTCRATCEHKSRDLKYCLPQGSSNDINIRMCEEDDAPSEFSTTASESKSEAKGSSSFQRYPSSDFSTSTSDCRQSSDWPAHTLEMDSYDLPSSKSFGNFGFPLAFWRFWKSKREPDKLHVSRSGFKRWKDGDASFRNISDEHVYGVSTALKTGYMTATEKDFMDSHSAENFDVELYKHSGIDTSHLNDISPCQFGGIFASYGLAMFLSDHSPAMISAVFCVLILVGVYFWSISTFLQSDGSDWAIDIPN